ncbi:discoidin domain-containing protein, partial [Ligaoa zhengdingensis]
MEKRSNRFIAGLLAVALAAGASTPAWAAKSPSPAPVSTAGGDISFIPSSAIESITADKQAPAGYEPEKAVDGDPSTIWHSPWNDEATEGFPHELIIEFTEPQQIDTIAYQPRLDGGHGTDPAQFINDYEFLMSDSANGEFTPVKELTKWTMTNERSEVSTRFVEPVTAKRIKFLIKGQYTEAADKFCTSVAELRFGLSFEPLESERVLRMTAIGCSSENPGYVKEFAVDGLTNTFWHNEWTPQAPFPHWIEIDMGHVYALTGLDILPRQDQDSMAITQFNLYAKTELDDEYTLVADKWTLKIPEKGEYAQIVLPESVPARYIKIESLQDKSGKNSAIAELTAWFEKGSESDAWMELYQGILAARKVAGSTAIGTGADQFPAEAVEAFLAAIDDAEAVLNLSGLEDSELVKAIEALADAQDELESHRILYTLAQLGALIEKAQQLHESAEGAGPTEEQLKAFSNAIENAASVMDAAQEGRAVHDAYKQLTAAVERIEGKINRSEISLAGVWGFKMGAFSSGETLEDTVRLPGTMDENQKGNINNNYTDKTRLTPRYTYVGKASYQKEIVVPDNWAGKKVTLALERTRKTKVWLNDILVGESDALGVAQTFDLTGLDPTVQNILTVEVDNSSYETQTWRSHMVVEETQGNWNGIVGEISLKMQEPVYIDDLRIYSDKRSPEDETVNVARIQLDVGNLTDADADVTVSVSAKSRNTEKPEQVVAQQTFSGTAAANTTTPLEFRYDMGDNVYLWDEFDPALYDFTVTLAAGDISETQTATSGMREFTADEDHFIINGKTIFLRGEANCAVFPLTAYPPMEKEFWLELLGTAREYGLNHYRFHSWSPPKAAYEAADELGMYLQPELYAFTGNPFAAGSSENSFYSRESKRIVKEMACHPSFTTFTFGNEMFPTQSDSVVLLNDLQKLDPTRLFATGSNNRCGGGSGYDPGDQFWISLSSNKGDGQIRGSNGAAGFINMETPATTRTYFGAIDGLEIPFVSHEIGQFQQYPDFDQIDQYTGVFDARNLKIAKASLESKGMGDQNKAFAEASGALAAICYRAEVEAALRTSNQGGYQLLGLQDFPGQGSALVGILNNFMEQKPGMPSGEEFIRHNSAVTALALMPQYVWTNDQTFTAQIQIANYGEGNLNGVKARWVLKHQNGEVIAQGEGETMDLPQGSLTTIGEVSASLASLKNAEQIKLEVGLVGDPILSNEYDVWVFPAEIDTTGSADIMIASSYNSQVKERLAEGGKVLLLPKINPTALPKSVNGNFTPTFWSGMWFPTTFNTMGFVTDETHPIFADFPTESHSNWQWWNLVKNSRPIILDDTDLSYRPILQAIDNFGNDKTVDGAANNRKLGLIFEGKVDGGDLLVCSIDLTRKNANKPEAKQLLSSILQYMESDEFAPDQTLDGELIGELIPGQESSGSIAVNDSLTGYPQPFASFSLENVPKRLWNIIDDNTDITEPNNSWTNWQSGEQRPGDHIGVDFGRNVKTGSIAIHVFTDHGCQPPKDFDLQYWDGSDWVSAQNQVLAGKEAMTQGENAITFDEVTTSKLRFVMQATDGYALAVSEFQVFGDYVTEEPSDVDKSYLEALIAAVDGKYEEERFTAESWAAFEEALTAAKDVVENDAATQEDVLSAYLDLVMARDSLTYAPDKSVLELAVDLANALLEDETLDLTDESIAALEEAIAAANLVIEDAEATQEDIDAAYEDVMYAIVSVMENEVDKEFLKSLIDQANNTIENHAGQYTASSIEALKEAAKAGQIVYDDPEA